MGLVELALIALLHQCGLGQGGCAAGARHQHGVRFGGQHLQGLARDGAVCALIAFGDHQLQAVILGELAEYLVPVFSVGVGKADEAYRLDPAFDHVLD